MEISQLRTLVIVSQLGSLSKAADRLCTAQPALSRHVRLLEEELGVQLFDRHGRGMILTEQGRIVLKHAERVLREIEEIRSSVVDKLDALDGEVSIGMPPTVAELLSAPLLHKLRRDFPHAHFRIFSEYSLHLFEWMHSGELDVAILYDPKAIRSLKSEPFLEEDLYVLAAAKEGLDITKPIRFKDLEGRPLIMPGPRHSLRGIVEEMADHEGIKLDVVIEAESFDVLKKLVGAGEGWTILPLGPMRHDISAGLFSVAPVAGSLLYRRLELAFPADRPVSRLANAVRKSLIDTTDKLVNSGAWPGKMLVHPNRQVREKQLPPKVEWPEI